MYCIVKMNATGNQVFPERDVFNRCRVSFLTLALEGSTKQVTQVNVIAAVLSLCHCRVVFFKLC